MWDIPYFCCWSISFRRREGNIHRWRQVAFRKRASQSRHPGRRVQSKAYGPGAPPTARLEATTALVVAARALDRNAIRDHVFLSARLDPVFVVGKPLW